MPRPRLARNVLRAVLGAGLLILGFHACAGNRFRAKPDVTPRLAQSAPIDAAMQAALDDPGAGPALSSEEQLEHAISRSSLGPRPEERERIAAEGVAAYLEEQLHPEAIDDTEFEQRLQSAHGLHELQETTAERVKQLVEFNQAKKEEREQAAREEAAAQLAADAGGVAADMLHANEMAGAGVASADVLHANELADAGAAGANMLHAKEMADAGPAPLADVRGKKVLGKIGRGPGFDFTLELAEAKLLRAVYSKRQLLEVMTDFWFNHFNVFAGKDHEPALLPAYENDVIRARALGSFRELLFATAHSPAMLIYLDNWRSTAADAPKKGKGAQAKNGRGLNENYARELLELHTLGVDGGYTQADVTEVARCFTGWSVADPNLDPTYVFHPRAHDNGEKHVLGQVIAAGGGEHDGEQVLELILRHPSTAHFIASKLVRRFVADDPPPALVDRVAAVYLSTLPAGGDIRSMLRAIFSSPEFWSRRALKSKMRSPLELVAASARALDANIGDPIPLAKQLGRIGEPLYAFAPPTGYGDTAQTWTASGALLARIDFGLALAAGQIDGIAINVAPLTQGTHAPDEVLARAAKQLGVEALSETTRSYVLSQLKDLSLEKKPQLVAERAVGLLLGAPELQRR